MSKQVQIKKAIENLIYEVKGQRVILDSDLAALYGVTNKRLLQQFSRNRDKFPPDFAYVLNKKEAAALQLQNEAAKGRGGRRTPPVVFTEHGAIMAATILNSEEAVAMSIFVVRAFVKMREVASHTAQWFEKLKEVEASLTKRMDGQEEALRELFMELEKLMVPSFPVPEKKRIGFRIAQDQ